MLHMLCASCNIPFGKYAFTKCNPSCLAQPTKQNDA